STRPAMMLLWAILFFVAVQKPPPMSSRFAQISKLALEARKQERWADAERLYQEAVNLRPEWKEGWWYLGTMFYDQDRYEDARAALRRFTVLDPKLAAGWAFLGLCEYETTEYDEALPHLQEAITL